MKGFGKPFENTGVMLCVNEWLIGTYVLKYQYSWKRYLSIQYSYLSSNPKPICLHSSSRINGSLFFD